MKKLLIDKDLTKKNSPGGLNVKALSSKCCEFPSKIQYTFAGEATQGDVIDLLNRKGKYYPNCKEVTI